MNKFINIEYYFDHLIWQSSIRRNIKCQDNWFSKIITKVNVGEKRKQRQTTVSLSILGLYQPQGQIFEKLFSVCTQQLVDLITSDIDSTQIHLSILVHNNIHCMPSSIRKLNCQESNVLQTLVNQQDYLKIKQYKKIVNQLNKKLGYENQEDRISGRSVKKELTKIYGKKKIQWCQQMEQILLEKVSKGWKWIKIAQEPLFKENKLTAIMIKQKFESDMRWKFRTIVRYSETQQLFPDNLEYCLSDRAFKVILQGETNEKLKSILTELEMKILLKIRPFFFKSLFDENGEKKSTRNPETQEQLMEIIFEAGEPLKNILNMLLKLCNSLRNKFTGANIAQRSTLETQRNTSSPNIFKPKHKPRKKVNIDDSIQKDVLETIRQLEEPFQQMTKQKLSKIDCDIFEESDSFLPLSSGWLSCPPSDLFF